MPAMQQERTPCDRGLVFLVIVLLLPVIRFLGLCMSDYVHVGSCSVDRSACNLQDMVTSSRRLLHWTCITAHVKQSSHNLTTPCTSRMLADEWLQMCCSFLYTMQPTL